MPDGKARCSYKMYGLKTGRTNPSTAKHPFNAPKAMRNLVAAPKDKIMVNFDYRSQYFQYYLILPFYSYKNRKH